DQQFESRFARRGSRAGDLRAQPLSRRRAAAIPGRATADAGRGPERGLRAGRRQGLAIPVSCPPADLRRQRHPAFDLHRHANSRRGRAQPAKAGLRAALSLERAKTYSTEIFSSPFFSIYIYIYIYIYISSQYLPLV